jgi:hypothetical protein
VVEKSFMRRLIDQSGNSLANEISTNMSLRNTSEIALLVARLPAMPQTLLVDQPVPDR